MAYPTIIPIRSGTGDGLAGKKGESAAHKADSGVGNGGHTPEKGEG